MEAMQSVREAVVEWFETSFKESAKATTKTSRLEDGKLSYRFSVVNDSGFNFDNFSFKIKVINKATNEEIGTATIKAGEWMNGEKKNFRSKLSIPDDVRSLSFVMYANSLEFEAQETEGIQSMMDQTEDVIREVGEVFAGTDGSGVFGELFGTGGMPETSSAPKTAPKAQTATKSQTAKKTRSPGAGSQTARRPQGGTTVRTTTNTPSFAQRKNEKKLNKKRLGKSGWTVATLATGLFFLLTAAGSSDAPEARVACGIAGVIALSAAGIIKLINDRRAKRIRTYEAKVNLNGNTYIDDLCAAVGRPYEKVADELQQMIVDGFFPGAYVDFNNRLLVMTRNGEPIESVDMSVAVKNKEKRKNARDKNVAPESIDDLITMTDDAEIKAKLKQLRTITKKIDARIEEVPALEDQVKDFREKYYPEVVRLTDDYNDKIADLAAKPSGKPAGEVTESASGAPVLNTNPNYLEEQALEIKTQLISLIDSVTEASENLLEKLHEDDIMDISTDIKMLQTTLASKGLLDSDFDL